LPRPAPVEWLCLIGGLFLVIHYSWLMDDAFVYYRYVDNLLYLGYGLVFNAGEYVEGFSSPLWTFVLIVCRATGLNYWIIIRLLGVASFIAFWALLVVLNRRLSPAQASVVNLPLCYLAFNYGVLCYFTSGLETPLIQVTAIAYALFVLSPRRLSLQVLLALSVILRHELAVPFMMCLAWAWVREKRFPWRLTLLGVLITASWMCFRIIYYADLFPNTFYLKDTSMFAQGWAYLQDTAGVYWLYPLLVVLILLTVVCVIWKPKAEGLSEKLSVASLQKKNKGGRRKKNKNQSTEQALSPSEGVNNFGTALNIPARLMMIGLALSITFYVIKIGGDARHYRYLAFPFCLCVSAFAGVVEHVWIRFSLRRILWVSMPIGLLVIVCSVSMYPEQLMRHPFFGKRGALCETFEEFHRVKTKHHQMVNKINDAWVHRHDPTLAQPPWGLGEGIELKQTYREFQAKSAVQPYVRVSSSAWCVSIYRAFHVRFVHCLGLTDPILSRTDMKAERPAHKHGLLPMAREMMKILRDNDKTPYPGMYRKAVEEHAAPSWIKDNLETIEVLERKMFNSHNPIENLRLAFTFPEKIKPPIQGE